MKGIKMQEEKNKVRKIFNLKQKEMDILEKIRIEHGFKSDTAALHFMFDRYRELVDQKKLLEMVVEEALKQYEEKCIGLHERLRWATRVAEQNSIMLLDAVNTILINNEIEDCVPVELIESPVIQESRRAMKEKIAYFKQKRDHRRK